MAETVQPSNGLACGQARANKHLGVVLVVYDSADVIINALETLFAAAFADRVPLRVVVVDNASPDDSVAQISAWQSGLAPYSPPADMPFAALPPVAKPLPSDVLQILKAGHNGGFAAGVNLGLKALLDDPKIDRFWVLNPDAVIPPGTVAAFAHHDPGPFALMGGRIMYYDHPDSIQIDGGLIDWRTGVTHNANQLRPLDTPPPQLEKVDFISGASMIASRAFLRSAGLMAEDYFLYYEEVDWALRRGDLPLSYCPGAVIYHQAGTSIGSPAIGRSATSFSLYFKHRARMMFLRRHAPRGLPGGWAYTLAKAMQLLLKGHGPEVRALLAGAWGARPPADVAARIAISSTV